MLFNSGGREYNKYFKQQRANNYPKNDQAFRNPIKDAFVTISVSRYSYIYMCLFILQIRF